MPLNMVNPSLFNIFCRVTMKTLQCIKTYSHECKVTDTAWGPLQGIYEDAVKEGCASKFLLLYFAPLKAPSHYQTQKCDCV